MIKPQLTATDRPYERYVAVWNSRDLLLSIGRARIKRIDHTKGHRTQE